MVEIERLLKFLGEHSRGNIIEKFKLQGFYDKVKNENDLLKIWASHIGPVYYSDSILPISRQISILKFLMSKHMAEYIENKAKILDTLSVKNKGMLERPAWDTLNFSDSKKGKRLQFGFKNKGCQYWHNSKNKLGCYNCGYFTGTQLFHFIDISEEEYNKNIIRQLKWIKHKYKRYNSFDVLEIEGDGSFFNPWEFPKQTQVECFKRLSKWENLSHILVESRPEFVNNEWIVELLKHLRTDQALEVAVGVESTDNFIRTHCINKGFADISEITKENSIKRILEEISSFNGRVRIQAYLLIKPAFLSENEALADAVNSGRVLYQWAEKFSPKNPNDILLLKYEPVVISRGTILETLCKYHNSNQSKLYTPLNYWTVAELLMQLCYDNTYKMVRFGAREDMDDYIAIPVIPGKNGTVSPIDFNMYHAIQRFSSNRDIGEFLSDIKPLMSDESYSDWVKTIGMHKTALEYFVDTYKEELIKNRNTMHKKSHSDQNIIQKLAHYLQNQNKSIEYFKEIVPEIEENFIDGTQKIEDYIRKARAILKIPKDWKIEVGDLRVVHESSYDKLIAKLHIEKTDKTDFALWLSIPLKTKEKENSKLTQEIERKYIIDTLPINIIKGRHPINIVQGYIAVSENEEVRVRKKLDSETMRGKYVLTRKSKGDLSREEAEEDITEEFFDTFIQATSGRIIDKDRYKIPYGPNNKWTLELDVYKGHLKGLITVDVEFPDREEEEEFKKNYKPTWFGEDVTFDRRFKNNVLATNGLATVLIPINRKYIDKALFLSGGQNASIPPEIKKQEKILGLKIMCLTDLVFETSGEINNDVVEVLQHVPLAIFDDTETSLNMLTKLAIREASRRPMIRLTKTDVSRIPEEYNMLKEKDNIPTVLSSVSGDHSLSDIVRSQQIVDNEILAKYEEEAKEIWVISTTLEFDVGDLFDVVHKNLSSGKKYQYFIPQLNSQYKYIEKLNSNHRKFWKLFEEFKPDIQMRELKLSEITSNFKEIVIYKLEKTRQPFGFTYIGSEKNEYELIKINSDTITMIMSKLEQIINEAYA